jgi:hypothetical protein
MPKSPATFGSNPIIENSPVPMPKPPTANANSAQPLETAPTVFTSAIELIDAPDD